MKKSGYQKRIILLPVVESDSPAQPTRPARNLSSYFNQQNACASCTKNRHRKADVDERINVV